MLKAVVLLLGLLALSVMAHAQTPPTPTYSAVIFAPQSGTPSTAEGKCWTQSTGFFCYYNGAPHGPFLVSGGTVGLTVGNTTIASGTATRVLYDNAGVLGEYTATQLTAQINAFSSSLAGSAPASGGGSSNFLRADGTWAVPPGTGTGTVTTTGSPASGNLTKFTGAASISNGDLSGDATTAGTLVVTIGKVNGVTYPSGPSANTVPVVTSATSGGSVTYEAVPNAALANSSITIAGHSVALGGSQAIACADLSNGATGCSTATGTSGATIPLLNGTNTWSGAQSFNDGDLKLNGSSSGNTTVKAASAAGTTTATLPNNSGTVAELNLAQTWSASQAGSITALSISTATFTPDASNNHYSIVLSHSACPCTLANPSPAFVAGTTGVIEVQQSSSGADTIGTWGSSYLAPSGTASIVLSTGANAIDVLAYYVIDSTHILLIPSLNFSH